MKIAHLTSVHPRFDTRIFHKQCRSLAAAGHEVTLVVADGKGPASQHGVTILDVGAPTGRASRAARTMARVIQEAARLNADLYHLHDPELLTGALWLSRREGRVLFDAHEDLPQDIMSKPYLRPWLRGTISSAAGLFERFTCRRLDGVVAATPFIRDKFRALGIRCVDVNNYPILGELEAETGWDEKRREVCYVGGINAVRGAVEIVAALELLRTDSRLNLAGAFQEKRIEDTVRRAKGWSLVNEFGFLDRQGVRNVLSRSVAGLVTLHPTSAYLASLPVKMFEYMSAGIPVIASNFPLWREIVEGNECGLCVDPLDPKAIAAAIDQLVENPLLAKRMGENGRRAIVERYNWANEERKLLQIYDEVTA